MSSSVTDTGSSEQHEWIIDNTYKLYTHHRIGSGSFGDIYKGEIIKTGEKIAAKIESIHRPQAQLYFEHRLYKVLQGGPGIPNVRWYGTEGEYNIMIMDLLGPSLENLFNRCGRKFSIKTICMIAEQVLLRVEYIHSKNFVHRDIKPDNFLIGRGSKDKIIYMIDLGLAKRYRELHSHRHIPYKETKGITGTVRYASINTHIGIEQTRRDDLEAVCYMLVYFGLGSLPWQGIRAKTKQAKYFRIGDKKMSTPPEVLCNGLPKEFEQCVKYVRCLIFIIIILLFFFILFIRLPCIFISFLIFMYINKCI